MASLILTPENQIQRLNKILNRVHSLSQLEVELLTQILHPKSWNVVEVIEHLSIAYSFYVPKVDHALSISPNVDEEPSGFKTRTWQKFVIEGQRPKNGKRPWKMKTLKRFEPIFEEDTLSQEKIDAVFTRFLELHQHLKQSIVTSRGKDVSTVKITSAIGSLVKFYLPEAFEFLICHLERHMVQIDGILEGHHQK